MVSHCANPACSVPLRYLREGRLFQFEVRPVAASTANDGFAAARKHGRRVWHYWLCGECSASMTLSFDGEAGLKLVPAGEPYSDFLTAGDAMKQASAI